MVQFDKVPLTKRYLIKSIKFAFRQPKIALGSLLLGIGPYFSLREYGLAKKFVPTHPIEERMINYSDTWQHIPTIYLLCLLKKPKTMVELGCRTGNTTLPMLYAAKEYHGHVYSIDIEVWPEMNNFLEKRKELSTYWTFINSDDIKLEWNLPIDFLCIDTSHYYDHTLAELKKYEPQVNHGGIIVMHDICVDDVRRAISDYFGNRTDIKQVRYFNNNGLGIIFKN